MAKSKKKKRKHQKKKKRRHQKISGGFDWRGGVRD